MQSHQFHLFSSVKQVRYPNSEQQKARKARKSTSIQPQIFESVLLYNVTKECVFTWRGKNALYSLQRLATFRF